MSDRGQRSERVGIVVYPNTKEKWEQSAEDDPDADSLSKFVRVAVNRYLHDRSNGSNAEASGEIHEHLADLQTQQQSALQRLDGMNDQLSDIRDAVVGSAVDPGTKDSPRTSSRCFHRSRTCRPTQILSGEYDTNGVPTPEEPSSSYPNDSMRPGFRYRRHSITCRKRPTRSNKQMTVNITRRCDRWLASIATT